MSGINLKTIYKLLILMWDIWTYGPCIYLYLSPSADLHIIAISSIADCRRQ